MKKYRIITSHIIGLFNIQTKNNWFSSWKYVFNDGWDSHLLKTFHSEDEAKEYITLMKERYISNNQLPKVVWSE